MITHNWTEKRKTYWQRVASINRKTLQEFFGSKKIVGSIAYKQHHKARYRVKRAITERFEKNSNPYVQIHLALKLLRKPSLLINNHSQIGCISKDFFYSNKSFIESEIIELFCLIPKDFDINIRFSKANIKFFKEQLIYSKSFNPQEFEKLLFLKGQINDSLYKLIEDCYYKPRDKTSLSHDTRSKLNTICKSCVITLSLIIMGSYNFALFLSNKKDNFLSEMKKVADSINKKRKKEHNSSFINDLLGRPDPNSSRYLPYNEQKNRIKEFIDLSKWAICN